MTTEKLFHYNAKVERVVDGDTIDVLLDLGFNPFLKGRIRFHGIDAPESRTRDLVEKKAGLATKKFVEDWVEDRNWTIVIQTMLDATGKYGRILGRILDKEGNCLNDILVEKGLATAYFGGSR